MLGVLGIVRVGLEDIAFMERDPFEATNLQGFAIVEPAEAARLVRRIPRFDAHQFRAVLARRNITPPSADDGQVIDELADLVRSGRLLVARREFARGTFQLPSTATNLADLAEGEPLAEVEAAPRPTFATFRLVDDRGAPIVEHPFKLDLPDGRTVEGITGPDGRFEVDPVANPGNCVLRFDPLP